MTTLQKIKVRDHRSLVVRLLIPCSQEIEDEMVSSAVFIHHPYPIDPLLGQKYLFDVSMNIMHPSSAFSPKEQGHELPSWSAQGKDREAPPRAHFSELWKWRWWRWSRLRCRAVCLIISLPSHTPVYCSQNGDSLRWICRIPFGGKGMSDLHAFCPHS